ncbi:hypothetical protein AS189_19150 (plasmid) [Arthrobacter alpinus]|uniref:Uncharacterized protein n=1 Tax=Arthrobacter alpinus TaxID=656366 RepID=A0A0S2M4Q4_9MICC|nr:hypothetical protein AS189_19150 [Arthrobacter alpinus]
MESAARCPTYLAEFLYGLIYQSDIADNFQAFCQWNDRRTTLCRYEEIVSYNAGYEIVAMRFRLP